MWSAIKKYFFPVSIPDFVPRSLTRAQIDHLIKTTYGSWYIDQKIKYTTRIEQFRDEGWWTPKPRLEKLSEDQYDKLFDQRFLAFRQKGWTYTIHIASDCNLKDLTDSDIFIRFL
jgi:hypothetical protein